MTSRTVLHLVLAAALALAPAAASAATIVIQNNDGAGEGFNDPTARAPVGGNPGVTLGQQRLNVFQRAADIWGGLLPSAVTIVVRAQFNPQTCTATSAVLGSAGPVTAHRDFAGAEFPATWYHQALANRLAGVDLDPANPDINATFNLSLDAGCFTGGVWYYGFDGNEGNDIELLPVVLHEIGHGLGFSTLTSGTTGAQNGGFPDVYSRFMLDNTTGLHWHQMSNAQRQASAINTGNLVWDGPAVNAIAPSVLSKRARLTVSTPALGDFAAGFASFGAALTQAGVTAQLILGQDGTAPVNDGCGPLVNVVTGRVVLLDRGVCAFTLKAQAAQNAGAVALIIANNVAGPPNELGGSDPAITIPVISVSQATGTTLKNQLIGGPVTVNIGLHPTLLAGADAAGHVMLYAPNPLEGGSSLSHWDVSVTPNALMEPFINDDLNDDVDLTIYHFVDIGWLDAVTAVSGPGSPARIQLRAAAPNPFTTRTALRSDLEQAGMVELAVYDLRGSLVKRIHSGYRMPGSYTDTWDGTDSRGNRVASGVYLYRLKTPQGSATKRAVLLP